LHNVAPKPRGILKTWPCGYTALGFAVFGLAVPACMAQPNVSAETPEWLAWGPFTVLLGVLVVALWRIRRLAVNARHRERTTQQRVEDLEHENAELRRTQEQMREYAEHDGLTGLWNHRIIMQRLRQEVDRSRRESVPLSVIMVDLDQFKNVNDTFGHPVGDRVLKEIGRLLQGSVRSYDWVGRYGGEEFLLILPGSSFANAHARLERLRLAVQTARIQHEERAIQVTASFGAASGFPTGSEEMIFAADAALYRAKENGRNCVVTMEIKPVESSAETVSEKLPSHRKE
jgi:diguanylate cyclase (GGDEF)-like protein